MPPPSPRALADWRAFPADSEGKESDESPGVFATLIVQLPSNVEGGVFTVSDPSASPNVMPGGGTEGAVARDGSSIAFSGEGVLRAPNQKSFSTVEGPLSILSVPNKGWRWCFVLASLCHPHHKSVMMAIPSSKAQRDRVACLLGK